MADAYRMADYYRQRDLERNHSWRFRNLGGELYPRQVARAYGGDLERTAAESDDQVAARVAAWECDKGFTPIDWHALGEQFRDDEDESPWIPF
jgi:hypothetical protein